MRTALLTLPMTRQSSLDIGGIKNRGRWPYCWPLSRLEHREAVTGDLLRSLSTSANREESIYIRIKDDYFPR